MWVGVGGRYLNQLLLEVFVLFPTDFLLMAMGFGDSKNATVSVCTLNSCAQRRKKQGLWAWHSPWVPLLTFWQRSLNDAFSLSSLDVF